jgi:cullin-associated NEDD8-dissociated protein 1
MSAVANQAPSAHTVALLLPKVYDADPDHRYMALSDLVNLLNAASPHILTNDYNISAKTVDALLQALKDKNGEVQNMAIQCLGPFVNKAADGILSPMIDKISTLQTGDTVDESVPSLALRAIVVSLPRPTPGVPRSKPVTDAAQAISKALIPRLVGYNVVPLNRKDLPKPPKPTWITAPTTMLWTFSPRLVAALALCFLKKKCELLARHPFKSSSMTAPALS